MHRVYAGEIVTPPPLNHVVEAARLQALQTYRVLGQHDVEGLAKLAQHVTTAFGGTRGAVSLVDADKVWFAGAFGLDRVFVAREGSFCDAVVRSVTALIVADATEDPRFWTHELVRLDLVRSFAGVPLVDEGGYALGAVSVMSGEPGAFEAAILTDLSGLARIVQGFLAESRAAIAPSQQRQVQGWLGVRTSAAGRSDRGRAAGGLIVLSVAQGSPAEQVGLRPTDILHTIDGTPLYQPNDVVRILAGRDLGSSARLHYRRGGVSHECDVVISAAPRRRGPRKMPG